MRISATAGLFQAAALIVLAILLSATVVTWPVPRLGFIADGITGEVTEVEPESPASRGGLLEGDTLSTIYGYPWTDNQTRLFLLPLPWQPGTPTPVTITRNGVQLVLVLQAGEPDLLTQVEKVLQTLLALFCWTTAYILGTRPHVVQPSLRYVGWFWLLLSGVLGIYQLQNFVSYAAIAGLLWIMCTVIAPLAVAVHFWYPIRPISNIVRRRAQRWLTVAVVVLNVGAVLLVLRLPHPKLSYEYFTVLTPYVFLVAFVTNGFVLWRAYRQSTVAHVRRQIRLITVACALVAWCWGTIFCLRAAAPSLIEWLPSSVLMFVTSLVPLAYLIGGIHPDLLRVDRVVRQLLLHSVVSFVTIVGVTLVWRSLGGAVSPLVFLVVVLAIYQPIFKVAQEIHLERQLRQPEPYVVLQHTVSQLGSSLDQELLAHDIHRGLTAAYHAPAAVYRCGSEDDPLLYLGGNSFSELPRTIARKEAARLSQFWRPTNSSVLLDQRDVAGAPELTAVIYHPAVQLVGTIRHPQQGVLGLIVLGPRPDGDPYRDADRISLQQLSDTAALAFVNCRSYAAQVTSQQLIRQLYHHLQDVQEQTAAEIAREIHDEVLNGNLRENIQTLHLLLNEVKEPSLQAELAIIHEGELTMARLLRLLCEQLQPAGMIDPLGLPATIRQHADRARAGWGGKLTVNLLNSPVPVSNLVHRELGRITREAIANAVKHANASEIVVRLKFPSREAEALVLTVTDDGKTEQKVQPRPGHWGLHYMQMSATAIGATISINSQPGLGTVVTVIAPLIHQQEVDERPTHLEAVVISSEPQTMPGA